MSNSVCERSEHESVLVLGVHQVYETYDLADNDGEPADVVVLCQS